MTSELERLLSESKLYRPGKPLRVFDALLHHPAAMRALRGRLEWGDKAVLSKRERELLILRTCAATRCAQELSVHTVVAADGGLMTADEVDRATSGGDGFSSRESALLAVADAICASDTLDDAQWQATSAELNPAETIEALVTVGYYRMVSGLQNALGVPAEEGFSLS